MTRRISWSSLLEVVVLCGDDVGEARVREWIATVGVDWASRADEHLDWMLGGDVDLPALSTTASRRLGSQLEARTFLRHLRASLRAGIAAPPPRVLAPAAERFERIEQAGGAKIRNRRYAPSSLHTGADFFARLHALFGEPDGVQCEGFQYFVRDRERARDFEAYTGSSGPAYGAGASHSNGFVEVWRDQAPTLDAFDRLLDDTPLADCRLAHADDWELICVDGVPMERVHRWDP